MPDYASKHTAVKLEEALTLLDRAIECDPLCWLAHYKRGLIYQVRVPEAPLTGPVSPAAARQSRKREDLALAREDYASALRIMDRLLDPVGRAGAGGGAAGALCGKRPTQAQRRKVEATLLGLPKEEQCVIA